MKILAHGFLFHPGAYLRSYWNILDFAVVMIGIISSITDQFDQNSPDKNLNFDFKSLRAIRVIRPLKLVNGVTSKETWKSCRVRVQFYLIFNFCFESNRIDSKVSKWS